MTLYMFPPLGVVPEPSHERQASAPGPVLALHRPPLRRLHPERGLLRLPPAAASLLLRAPLPPDAALPRPGAAPCRPEAVLAAGPRDALRRLPPGRPLRRPLPLPGRPRPRIGLAAEGVSAFGHAVAVAENGPLPAVQDRSGSALKLNFGFCWDW